MTTIIITTLILIILALKVIQQGIRINDLEASDDWHRIDNERIRVTSNGNVGLGSKNPTSKLKIINK